MKPVFEIIRKPDKLKCNFKRRNRSFKSRLSRSHSVTIYKLTCNDRKLMKNTQTNMFLKITTDVPCTKIDNYAECLPEGDVTIGSSCQVFEEVTSNNLVEDNHGAVLIEEEIEDIDLNIQVFDQIINAQLTI